MRVAMIEMETTYEAPVEEDKHSSENSSTSMRKVDEFEDEYQEIII
jgi:hypothetical protein